MKWTLVVIAVVLASAWGWTTHARAVNEHALATVATDLSGQPVHVHCETWFAELVDVSDNSGFVPFDQNGRPKAKTDLKRDVCGNLTRFRESTRHPAIDCLLTIDWSAWSYSRNSNDVCPRRAWDVAEAINTLSHESMHMRGFAAEAVAQCYAIQEDAWTTMRLGGTYAEGQAVAAFLLALQPGVPDVYQSSSCRRGGELDLHPQTPDWPTEKHPGLPPISG